MSSLLQQVKQGCKKHGIRKPKVAHVMGYTFKRRTARGYIAVTNCEGTTYRVRFTSDFITCNCPDFTINRADGTACKHIEAVVEYLK